MNRGGGFLRRWLALFFCLLISLSVVVSHAVGKLDDKQSPLAEVPDTIVDLGKIQEGDLLTACFDLHNAGKEVLLVHKVKSGCGCTRVDYPQEIAPTTWAEVCLTIDTLGTYGKRKFKAAIYCNDPARSVIVLKARAQIIPMVTLTPDRVFFRDMVGRDLLQEIRIETSGQRPMTLQLASYDLENKISVVLESLAEGKCYRLSVKNHVSTPGSYRGRIFLRSDHPGRERIVIPVFAHLTPPVAVYPSQLVLDTGRCPACRASGRFSGTLVVRAHDHESLQILSVEPNPKGLNFEIEPLISDCAYRLSITYDDGIGSSLQGPLVINTNRSDPIEVPLHVKR